MPKNTSEKLIRSMYELIGEVGYERASINNICKNVGVTKSSFYHFFDSKEQMFLEIVDYVFQTGFEEDLIYLTETATKENYKETLLEVGFKIFDSSEDNNVLRKVLAEIYLQSERIQEIKKVMNKSVENRLLFFQKALQHGMKLDAFPIDFDVIENAEILLTIYLGLDTVVLHGLPVNVKNVMRKTIEGMFKKKTKCSHD